MRRTLILTAALAFLALGEARGFGSGDKGVAGAQFLKVTPGARPSGMGEAFAGVADDVNAIYYNPAGLGTLRRVEVTGMHDSYLQGINYEYGALAVPILSWTDAKQEKNAYGVLGAAVYNLSVGGIERRSVNESDAASDTFGSSDFAYALSYAYEFPETGLSLGLTAKAIEENLDSSHASAFAADFGALYRWGRLGLGAGVRNAGTRARFSSVSDPLPVTLFTGLGFKVSDALLATVEVDAPRDDKANVGFGAEYRQKFVDKLTGSVRGGYTTRNSDSGGASGATFGLGIGYGNLSFDFAFIPFGDLGNAFKYSLTAKF
ncbi:MAG: PorV/PorQ family protein [Elusimicrobia bacterium]|nr:PorV/PorQ family protein [Elusimicrobiota bacterium]